MYVITGLINCWQVLIHYLACPNTYQTRPDISRKAPRTQYWYKSVMKGQTTLMQFNFEKLPPAIPNDEFEEAESVPATDTDTDVGKDLSAAQSEPDPGDDALIDLDESASNLDDTAQTVDDMEEWEIEAEVGDTMPKSVAVVRSWEEL